VTAIAVVGAGSWGTALAHVFAAQELDVRLWARKPALAEELGRSRENRRYLPGVRLPESVAVSSDLGMACVGAEIVVFAVPTQAMRSVSGEAASGLGDEAIVVSAAKGFESGSLLTMTSVLRESVGEGCPAVAMSGPNIASEIGRGLPAATVVAGNREAAERVREVCSGSRLRFYSSTDVVGVEHAGALKNVVAIAAGVCDGLGVGDNGKAAIITRGLAEMARLGVAAGGQALTFAGLTGLGDCVATCMSRYSRNRGLGEAIARGGVLADVIAGSTMVVEGVAATQAAVELAERHDTEMPIAAEVHRILFEAKPIAEAMADLMNRGSGDELRGLGLSVL
jgi:glycerol-3-phosphate dehydrogenase (NAD(P)+)